MMNQKSNVPMIHVDTNETYGTEKENEGGPQIIEEIRNIIGNDNVIEKPLIVDYMIHLPTSLNNLLPWQIKHMVWEYIDDERIQNILEISKDWGNISLRDSLENTERLRGMMNDVGITSPEMYNTLFIERKRIDDFFLSIRDGRLDKQAELMRSKSFIPPVFIVEGSKYKYAYEYAKGMQIRGTYRIVDDIADEIIGLINGMMLRLKTFWDCVVIEVPHDEDNPHPYTARSIVGVIKYLSKERELGNPRDYHHKVKTLLDVQRNILQSISGIGYKKAKSIISYYLKDIDDISLVDILTNPKDILKPVKGIGPKLSERVRLTGNTTFKEAETIILK